MIDSGFLMLRTVRCQKQRIVTVRPENGPSDRIDRDGRTAELAAALAHWELLTPIAEVGERGEHEAVVADGAGSLAGTAATLICSQENHEKSRDTDISGKPRKRKVKRAVRVQYGVLPYRFTHDAALEILLLTTRRSKRWIIPKGWPIKGLRPAKSAAREAFEEAGVRGRVGAKSIGVFAYDKILDENGIRVSCEVRVFPLLVKRQSETWPEIEQRLVQWVAPEKALMLIRDPELKALVAAFAKRVAIAASKSTP